MEIGLIGLGRMGANMTRRLMRAGHRCVVYDVFPASVQALTGAGASGAASLAGVRAALTGPGAATRRAGLGVTTSSVVLLLSTEGTGRNGGT